MTKIRTTISLQEDVFKVLDNMSKKSERTISQQLSYLVKKGDEQSDIQQFNKRMDEMNGRD